MARRPVVGVLHDNDDDGQEDGATRPPRLALRQRQQRPARVQVLLLPVLRRVRLPLPADLHLLQAAGDDAGAGGGAARGAADRRGASGAAVGRRRGEVPPRQVGAALRTLLLGGVHAGARLHPADGARLPHAQ